MKIFCVIIVFLFSQSVQGSRHSETSRLLVKTVDEILRHKAELHGHNYIIIGFARFNRVGQRGLLYRNLRELKQHRYQDAIFLQMDLEKLWTKSLPDGARVMVTGHLDKDLHGSLGVYPAHVVVKEIHLARVTSRE